MFLALCSDHPSSVRLSVCKLLIFIFLSGINFNQTLHRTFWVKEKGHVPSEVKMHVIAKLHWRHLKKTFFSTTIGAIFTKNWDRWVQHDLGKYNGFSINLKPQSYKEIDRLILRVSSQFSVKGRHYTLMLTEFMYWLVKWFDSHMVKPKVLKVMFNFQS